MIDHKKGVLMILLSTIAFGSYGTWSRLIGDSFGVFYQGWTRALIITLILLPILIYRKEIISIQKKDLGWLAIFLLFTTGTQAPLFYAFNHMDISSATLLFFVTMLITMYGVGFIFLSEKVSVIKIISLILAAVGLYVVFSFSVVQFSLLAALMAALNGVASGGEVAFSKKISSSYSPLYLTWLSWLVIIPTNGVLSLMIGEKQHIPSLDIAWLWQAAYVIASIFAFYLIIAGLKHLEASIGGLLGLLEVLWGITFGIIIFNEILTIKIILGGFLIISAAALPHLYELRKRLST
ncbi:MAG TPA: DMT family transporter [Candidatus Paceibacterota bacterium]